jgi:hypothetical protein
MIKLFRLPVLLISLIGISLLVNHPGATAARQPTVNRSADRAAPSPTPARTDPVKTFATQRFSVTAPANWQMLDAKSDALILTTPKSTASGQDLKLDVGVQPQSLEAVAKRRFDSEDTRLVKTERLTINGRPALRQYFEDGEFYDRTILTYIADEKGGSAYLSGFYFASNPNGAAAIIAIQNSFQFR